MRKSKRYKRLSAEEIFISQAICNFNWRKHFCFNKNHSLNSPLVKKDTKSCPVKWSFTKFLPIKWIFNAISFEACMRFLLYETVRNCMCLWLYEIESLMQHSRSKRFIFLRWRVCLFCDLIAISTLIRVIALGLWKFYICCLNGEASSLYFFTYISILLWRDSVKGLYSTHRLAFISLLVASLFQECFMRRTWITFPAYDLGSDV